MANQIAIIEPARVGTDRWVSFCRCGCKGMCGATSATQLRERIHLMTAQPQHQQRRRPGPLAGAAPTLGKEK